MSNCFQSPKCSGRVWCLDRKLLLYHKKANPNESGKKWEHHTTDTSLQVNSWASHYIKLQPSVILYNTSNFQGLGKQQSITNPNAEKSFCPSQGHSVTSSCVGTWAASSRHVLENSSVQRSNAISLRLCYPLHIVDKLTCTFIAAFLGFLTYRLETLRKRDTAVTLQNQ